MDALVPAFVIALAAEFGDGTQMLAAALGARYRARWAVLGGIAFACAINMALAAAAGVAAASLVDHRAIRALVGLSLLLAGLGALFRATPPPALDGWRLGAFGSSAGSFLILQFGDKTQFVAMAIAAAATAPALAAGGAAMGVVVASVPAVLIGAGWGRAAPWRAIRAAIGVVLAVAGLVIGVRAIGIA